MSTRILAIVISNDPFIGFLSVLARLLFKTYIEICVSIRHTFVAIPIVLFEIFFREAYVPQLFELLNVSKLVEKIFESLLG